MPSGGGSGDIIVDSPTSTRLLLISSPAKNTAELGWWKTTDSGLTWSKGSVIYTVTDDASDGLETGTLVQNYTQDGMIVLSQRVSKTNLFRKMSLMGVNGAVKRPLNEASQITEILKEMGDLPENAWSAKGKMKAAQSKINVDNPEP